MVAKRLLWLFAAALAAADVAMAVALVDAWEMRSAQRQVTRSPSIAADRLKGR